MQGLPVTRTSIQFEVQALRGTRWVIELVSADGAAALERGRQLLQRADIDGVKVWQEVQDRSTGRTAGRLVLAETKPQPKRRRRIRYGSPLAPAAGPSTPEPAGRRVTAPPARGGDRGMALVSLGGACAALVGLAVLVAIS